MKLSHTFHVLFTATALAVLAAVPGVAAAAQQGGTAATGSGQQAATTSEAAHYSDQQLKQFVAAYYDLKQIHQQYAQKLKNANTAAEAQKIKQDGRAKMVNAIKRDGLDVHTYVGIARKAGKSAELRSKLEALLMKHQKQ